MLAQDSCNREEPFSNIISDPKWKDVEVVIYNMRCEDKNVSLAGIIGGNNLHKADILVSELLGSFGDNEMSPECLDGFQQSSLMEESGLSILQR